MTEAASIPQWGYKAHHGEGIAGLPNPYPNAPIYFHADRHRYKFRLISSGTGGGKTFAGVFEDLYWAMKYDGCVGYIFEPTYKMVNRILIPTLEDEQLLGKPLESNPLVSKYNRSDNFLEFINGSKIWFASLEDPEMSEGSNIDFAHIDEPRLVRDFPTAWQTIRRRLRGSQRGKYPIGAWLTTTPDVNVPYEPKTRSGSMMYSFFEYAPTRNDKAQIYSWSVEDNPYLSEDYIQDVKDAHTGGYYDRFVLGKFAEVGIGTFPFDYNMQIVDTVPALSKVGFGVDWGWTNPCAILGGGVDGDGRAYIAEEFYGSRKSIEEMIEAAQAMVRHSDRGYFECDPSQPQSIDKFKRAGLLARGNKTKREEGILDIASRMKPAGDGRPRLFIHKSCVNTISEIQTYDDKVKERDHAVDALRYMLMGLRKSKVWVGD